MTELTDERLAAIRERMETNLGASWVHEDRALLLAEVDRLRQELLETQDGADLLRDGTLLLRTVRDKALAERDEARRVAVELWVKDDFAGGHRDAIERFRKELADV